MCKCGKKQAGNKESDSGEEEEEEVPVQPKTEQTPKPSSDSTHVAKDMKGL